MEKDCEMARTGICRCKHVSRPGIGQLVFGIGLLIFELWPMLMQAEAAALLPASGEIGACPGLEAASQQTGSTGQTAGSTRWKVDPSMLFSPAGEPLTPEAAQLIAALELEGGQGLPVSRLELMTLLSRPEVADVYYDKIIKVATPASLAIQKEEHKNYTQYFLEHYLETGVAFLHSHQEILQRAEEHYGVLQKDIVATLIWESGLGKYTGDFLEVNIFLGQILFLDAGQREAVEQMVAAGKPNPLDDPVFARKERTRLDKRKKSAIAYLATLLRYCKEEGQDPFTLKGSWGGAMGYVQFMPASMKYAVDADGDGLINLYQWPDAIMSAANYLKTVGHYAPDEASRTKALLRYNPSEEYAAGVILLADTIWQHYLNGE